MINFYPRSPCGERRRAFRPGLDCIAISIHALLAESDAISAAPGYHNRDFYPRSPCGERRNGYPHTRQRGAISIHALLAESDSPPSITPAASRNFYPRSPCGERPCGGHISKTRGEHFYPRSPCGERPDARLKMGRHPWISIHALLAESDERGSCSRHLPQLFLSTLSLRRATPPHHVR